ncbi:MAG: L-threonylcarbamoyladenylate synthase [Prevotella sp.]|nr:L-threonylcarbamoyladenylate synthase [Bacteroides sp.]MCM1366518.1 L-threonylcarbamoyladenylate synthase [Prevotella sp.]
MTFEEDLKNALQILQSGGVIIYPTDTIWGLGCDATNSEAVKKLYKIKERTGAKACISLVCDISQLERYLKVLPQTAEMLIEAAVYPLTIIYDTPLGFAPELLAEDGSAAMRITSERYSKELCRRLRKPIVSTSANFSGHPAPCSFNDIDKSLIEKVDYVAHHNHNTICASKPSEIIKVGNDEVIKLIRR